MKAPWTKPRNEARRRLGRLLSKSGPIDVVEAAFCVALEEYPELDVKATTRELEALGSAGASRVDGERNPFARLDRLQAYMFDELGFCGNHENYDDPRNFYLNEVLIRRTGIPLTLSIVFLQLARAAGFESRGVGLPGHFVARLTWEGRTIYVDPYHGASVITPEDCRELVGRSTGRPTLFRDEQLRGVAGRAMIGRLLLNLKHLYLNQSDYRRALGMVERLLLVSPGNTREIRDKGFLEAHLGRPAEAIADLETYLELAPKAPDIESVRGRVVWLRRKLSEIN